MDDLANNGTITSTPIVPVNTPIQNGGGATGMQPIPSPIPLASQSSPGIDQTNYIPLISQVSAEGANNPNTGTISPQQPLQYDPATQMHIEFPEASIPVSQQTALQNPLPTQPTGIQTDLPPQAGYSPSGTAAVPDQPAISMTGQASLTQTSVALDDQHVDIQPLVTVPTSQQIEQLQTNTGDNMHEDARANNANNTAATALTYHSATEPVSQARREAVSKNTKSPLKGLFKLVLLLVIPLTAVGITGTVLVSTAKEKVYQREKEVLLTIPMKNVNWQDLGNVFEPVIDLPIKTASSYESWEFLIDSGAVISSLPNEWAAKTGQDLAFMKRSTFRGFGGKTSFAYQGEMRVRLGDEDVLLPVVFTEASGTKSLLGRKGFFENYSLYFNHKERRIEIRK
jgi:hypothetical protein